MNFDLYIYNNLTNEVEIIHNFGKFFNLYPHSCIDLLNIYTEYFIKKQIPFRVEFVFIK